MLAGSASARRASEAPAPGGGVAGGAWAVVRVSDQGVGIPTVDLPHIFERFHRAGNVAGRIDGTGVGLASARHNIEQHGGAISVHSEEGAGTTVTIRLPLAGPFTT